MSEKTILYIGYYYKGDVIAQRGSEPYISQACMNKMNFLRAVFTEAGYHTFILSNAWTNSRSLKRYKGFTSEEDPDVRYTGIFGVPVLNAVACICSGKRFIRKFVKEHKPEYAVFYNVRWETSALALYMKRKYKVPVILEYEDGLSDDRNNSLLKRFFYSYLERKTLKRIDGAILVNSGLKEKIHCPYMISRGGAAQKEGKMLVPEAGEKKIFLFASTLDEQRGLDILLKAAGYLKEDFRLLVTGRGELSCLLENNTDDRIEYLGYLSYEEYQEVLKKAHICICAQKAKASFGQVSFPSKIFEYLSEHKLVITSDVVDAKQYLNQIALVYSEDDPKRLAECMKSAIQILDNEEKRRAYEKQIERCIRENSIQSVAGVFRDFVAEIE